MATPNDSRNRTVVPATDLAAVIQPLIEELRKNQPPPANEFDVGDALSALRTDVSRTIGISEGAVTRRLWGICNGDTLSIDADYADAILEALGTSIWLEDLPVFPSTLAAARDLTDIHTDLSGFEHERFARSLYNFSMAFLEESAPDETRRRVRHGRDRRRAAKAGLTLDQLLRREARESRKQVAA